MSWVWVLVWSFASPTSPLFRFVSFLLNRTSKQFFSHVRTEPPLPGYYQYFLGGKCILLKETTRRPEWEWNPRPLAPESDILALGHRPSPSPLWHYLIYSRYWVSKYLRTLQYDWPTFQIMSELDTRQSGQDTRGEWPDSITVIIRRIWCQDTAASSETL